jgi:fermentation-respiration switch protein FrsA (DUF1100 family)
MALLLSFFENSLIYAPSVYPSGRWQPVGLECEDAYFQSPDGTKLHGWYVPHERPRAVILFSHGNGGNLSHRGETVAAMVCRLQVSVLIYDYRGYGRSQGRPNEAGVLADGRSARAWLARRAGIAEADVVLFGESLGGAVAVDLAAHDGARGLIVENTFSSLPEIAAHHFWWFPVRLLMRTRLDSAAKIGNYHGPLLQIHAEQDSIVPVRFAKRLFDQANEPKTWITVAGADHNDPQTPEFYRAIEQFLDQLPAVTQDPAAA